MSSMIEEVFGEPIYQYTAEQAVEDGLLLDCRQIDGAAGEMFRKQYKGHPVYLTAALADLIDKAVSNTKCYNDWAGVCWDVVWMSRGAVAAASRHAQRNGFGRETFQVIITGTGRTRYHRLDVVVDGNGLTFCLEGED